MSKTTIQWRDGNAWREAKADLKCTRNSNLSCEHNGQILVFPNLKEGAEVVGLENGKWVKAGRITRGLIFLGPGLSYSETNEQLFRGSNPREILAVQW